MDHNRAQAYQLHEGDVVHDGFFNIIVIHKAAAVFDDNCLLSELFDIGQRLDQDIGLFDVLRHVLCII